MKASLCLEAASRPQWPRLYLLSRPRYCGRIPSLVSNHGQVLRVLGWALTQRMHNLSLVLHSAAKRAERQLCVEQSRELFSDIRGRGGASSPCLHS